MMLFTPEFWPPISHIQQIFASKQVAIQEAGTYQKQSNLNRCKIAGVNGILTLSVPLVGGREQKTFFKDVLIDNSQRWPVQHLRTLQSCYGKAPFFDYYFPLIEILLSQPHQYLLELNKRILEQIMKWLRWKGEIMITSHNWSKTVYTMPQLPPYVQVFADRQPFHPDLSILDLLFCTGPQAGDFLQEKAAF